MVVCWRRRTNTASPWTCPDEEGIETLPRSFWPWVFWVRGHAPMKRGLKPVQAVQLPAQRRILSVDMPR